MGCTDLGQVLEDGGLAFMSQRQFAAGYTPGLPVHLLEMKQDVRPVARVVTNASRPKMTRQ